VTQISLQLHATLEDLRDLVIRWASDQVVAVAAQQHTEAWLPMESVRGLESVTDVQGASTRIALACGVAPRGDDPDLRGLFVIDVGVLTGEGLRESAMGVVDEDAENLKIWRGLIRAARREAHKGASVVNPVTNERTHLPSHPHLAGAHRLAARGVAMLAAGGWNRYEFDDLAQPDT